MVLIYSGEYDQMYSYFFPVAFAQELLSLSMFMKKQVAMWCNFIYGLYGHISIAELFQFNSHKFSPNSAKLTHFRLETGKKTTQNKSIN